MRLPVPLQRLFLPTLFVLTSPTGAQEIAERLQEAFEDAVEAGQVLGAQIEVGNAQGPTTSFQFGHVSGKQDVAVTEDTLFFIASVTKPLTATCVMRLTESGTIGLEDPVEKWMPGVLSKKTKDGEDLIRSPTIRELLSHRSGLYPNSAFYKLGYSESNTMAWAVRDLGISLEEAVKRVGKHPFSNQPGTKYGYSSAGFFTLGRCIEIACQRTFDDVFMREVCRPLGMDQSTFLPAEFGDTVALPRKSLLQSVVLTQGRPQAPHHMNTAPRMFSPGSGIYSTARDLGKFARMMLNQGRVDGTKYLSIESWKELTSKQVDDSFYGLGWKLQSRNDTVTAIFHDGSVLGCKGRIYIDLKSKTYRVAVFTLADISKKKIPAFIQLALQEQRVLGAIFDGKRKSEGLIVKEVFKSSPAGEAGIKPGDQVIEMNGQQFRSLVPANQGKKGH